MSQLHLDRMGAMDASFLLQEGPTSHAHVGGIVILEGPAPPIADLRGQIAGRLDLIPRYRQRLAHTALDRARPVWVDDTRFDLEYHVRHIALPAPGDREQWHRAVAQAYSQPLDRTRPLWEQWFVEGLEGGRVGVIFKVHHAMVDGHAAVDLLKLLCDVSPVATPSASAIVRWQPQPTPSSLRLLGFAARGAARAAGELAAGAVGAAKAPARTLKEAVDIVEGAGGLILKLLGSPPKTPLTAEICRHRRFVEVLCQLDDAKLVKNTFGATVNDVALALVTGALREFLRSRDVCTAGMELSALVPVSRRGEQDHGRLGNRIAVLRGTLPVHVEDPVQRLAAVSEAMLALKNSKQALGTEFILGAQDYLPPMVLPITTRINVSPRMHNVMVTNIPGPQMPLYILGRELVEVVPLAMLHPEHPLAIAVTSYNGQLNFGLLGDYEALPDIAIIGEAISAGMEELVARCRQTVQGRARSAPRARAAREEERVSA